MSTATVTSKGQITLPKEVRESLALDAGDKVDFVRDAEGGFRVLPRRRDIRVNCAEFSPVASRNR